MSNKAALKKFTKIAANSRKQIDIFRDDLANDPARALIWGTSAFEHAARISVAEMLIYCFTEREGEPTFTIEQARKTLLDRVINKSLYPARSTSPTSNLMEQCESAACAEALVELKEFE